MKHVGTAEERALARGIALKIKRRLPEHVPVEDLLQAALIGLWSALQRMPEGITPEHRLAYLKLRIRGRVIDELRALDWFSRSARDSGANPSMMHADAFEVLMQGSARTPEEVVSADASVAVALDSLDARRRALVVEIAHGHRQRVVAAAMRLTESRVSQMYQSALRDMRTALEAQ